MRVESHEVKLLSGETVTLRVGYEVYMESKSNTVSASKNGYRIIHRVLIPQPMATQEQNQWTPCRPHDCAGKRIEVTAHANEHGEIVERWVFSDDDVRWYRIEIADPERKVLKLRSKEFAA